MQNQIPSFVPTYSQDNSILTVSPQSSSSIVLPLDGGALSGAGYFSYHPDGTPLFPPESYVTPMYPHPQPVPLEFFVYDEFYHYRIHCKRISYETIECLLNNSLVGFNNVQSNEYEFNFVYRQQFNQYNNEFYQISCRIAPPGFINHCLNKRIFGIENMGVTGQKIAFTLDQKENLKSLLKQFLSQRLLS